MRVDKSIIFIWGCAALMTGACSKKETPKPEPATAQVSKPEVPKPVTPEIPSKPDMDHAQADKEKGPIDRDKAIQATLAAMERGAFDEAFKFLDSGMVWTEIGLPQGELKSIPALIDYQKRSRTGLSDFRMKAKRIIDSADYQVVEFVWSARHTGAFADGTAPTNKTVTLPGAMLVRYQDDGLIDRVWVFQDWPNALQQLGLAPDLPAAFKPFELPESTEIVHGDYVPSFREHYETFLTKLGPADYQANLSERTAPDFAWIDLATGERVAANGDNANLALRRGSFVRTGTHIETAIGTSNIFAAYVTNQFVYKGGLMGVESKDQDVTTHTLDIIRFDPETMRMQTLASYGNSYEVLAALQVTAAGAQKPTDDAVARLDVGACDDYVADMRTCLETLDGDKKAEATKALDDQIRTWQQNRVDGLAKDQLKASCEAATATARVSFGQQCPRVDWD
ncbi:MAG: ester cyclase [Myxococcota bacterium]